jgi:hypothetical protein
MAALLAATSFVWVAPVEAQTRYREPAEFPPASFAGSQFVDSRGCIFVRAGIAGSTTWVPRVTSSRQNLCGAKPTFADGASAQNRVPAQAALPPGATLITVPPVAAAGQAQAQAQTGPTATATPKPRVQAAPTATAQTSARPRIVQLAPTSQAPAAPINARVAPKPPVAETNPGAPMRTVASITTAPKIRAVAPDRVAAAGGCAPDVRCGPQTQDPVPRSMTPARAAEAQPLVLNRRTQATLDPQTRIVPRHVAASQAQTADIVTVPTGYRPVWNDDRLNPRRAQGTIAGKAAMDLVWTQTVPRRLIDRTTGRDMTAFNPNLQYPYTDLATQVRASVPAGSAATLSTRATPQPVQPPKPQPVAGRFVQVGAFADHGNADAATRRLQAAGLPVAIQNVSSKGRPVQVILAGPFGDPAALSQGLGAARAAGFRDAFARN